MENRSYALLAGLFALVFALAAAGALWWFSETRDATHTYLLETRGSVTGLNIESAVRYRGIRAGKVEDIRPDADDPRTLLVEISLDRRYRLTDRTVAKLNQQGITGLAYVMLEDDPTGAGQPLPVDGARPGRIAIQPGFLDMLGNRAGDIAGQASELALRLNRLLDERNTQNVAATLDGLAAASEGLRELPALMKSLRAAVSDENLARLRAALAQAETATAALTPLAADIRQLAAALGSLTERLERTAAEAERAGGRINAATLPRAEALAEEMTAATRRLDRLLHELERAPQAALVGKAPVAPGPGETGHVSPPARKTP
jgi:phospholipid/cholesterol/gamma-HCH transport system substrate-binding protein